MLHLPETDLKKTRFYQDVFREGRQEGRQEGEADVLLRLLRRKLGHLTEVQESLVRELQVDRLESLAEALLDFDSSSDFDKWLESK